MIGNDRESSMSLHAGIGIRSTAAMHTTKNRAPHPIVLQSTPIARQHSHEASGMMRTASRTVTAGPDDGGSFGPAVSWTSGIRVDVAFRGGVRGSRQAAGLVLDQVRTASGHREHDEPCDAQLHAHVADRDGLVERGTQGDHVAER
jgi:hypothetical protein